MFNRKEAKKRAKTNLKKHYVIFVLACLLAAFLGAEYDNNLAMATATKVDADVDVITVDTVLDDLLEGKLHDGRTVAEKILSDLKVKNTKVGLLELGHAKGVLSSLVNTVTSGTYLVTIYRGILTMFKSKTVSVIIFIILVLLVFGLLQLLIVDAFRILYRRIFLESFSYDKVPISRYTFLLRVKKWFSAPLVILVKDIFLLLWSLTIVGGIIKSYSYRMVEYIVAENPDIKPMEAINLSRKMMNGHKWEAFVLDLSFLPWHLLSILTLGLSSIFFASPYIEATELEYFVHIRKLAYENNVENVTLLNDKYLYEYADESLILEAYKDAEEMSKHPIEIVKNTGFKGFLENNFGVVLNYTEEDEKYNQAIEREDYVKSYEDIKAFKKYPVKLFPIKEADKKNKEVHYMRRYSIWSVIILFFAFCLIGWLWEVGLHLVKDGVFVNRGTMHGPWLPIYGCGGVAILLCLYRVRKKPALTLVLGMVLAGIIEYAGATYLWVTKHMKWWDYSGYFLNLNGRICLEGLLVFGIAGVAAVYFVAPLLDNRIRKIPNKVLIPICLVLSITFICDMIYSHYHPNAGKGITDYDSEDTAAVIHGRMNL